MEEIKKWRTEDGSIFDTTEEAQAHETLIGRVKEIIHALGEPNKNLTNGNGYFQHDPEIVKKIRKGFYELALQQQGYPQGESDENVPSEYWIGRHLEDSSFYLYDAWRRLQCIDEFGREFDQPYYANNPDKAKLIEFK